MQTFRLVTASAILPLLSLTLTLTLSLSFCVSVSVWQPLCNICAAVYSVVTSIWLKISSVCDRRDMLYSSTQCIGCTQRWGVRHSSRRRCVFSVFLVWLLSACHSRSLEIHASHCLSPQSRKLQCLTLSKLPSRLTMGVCGMQGIGRHSCVLGNSLHCSNEERVALECWCLTDADSNSQGPTA